MVDAALSPDCKTVAVVTMDQEGGTFLSQVLFFPVDQKEPKAQVSLGSVTVLDLDYEDGLLWVLGEDRVMTLSDDGKSANSYPFGRSYLKGCDFGGGLRAAPAGPIPGRQREPGHDHRSGGRGEEQHGAAEPGIGL